MIKDNPTAIFSALEADQHYIGFLRGGDEDFEVTLFEGPENHAVRPRKISLFCKLAVISPNNCLSNVCSDLDTMEYTYLPEETVLTSSRKNINGYPSAFNPTKLQRPFLAFEIIKWEYADRIEIYATQAIGQEQFKNRIRATYFRKGDRFERATTALDVRARGCKGFGDHSDKELIGMQNCYSAMSSQELSDFRNSAKDKVQKLENQISEDGRKVESLPREYAEKRQDRLNKLSKLIEDKNTKLRNLEESQSRFPTDGRQNFINTLRNEKSKLEKDRAELSSGPVLTEEQTAYIQSLRERIIKNREKLEKAKAEIPVFNALLEDYDKFSKCSATQLPYFRHDGDGYSTDTDGFSVLRLDDDPGAYLKASVFSADRLADAAKERSRYPLHDFIEAAKALRSFHTSINHHNVFGNALAFPDHDTDTTLSVSFDSEVRLPREEDWLADIRAFNELKKTAAAKTAAIENTDSYRYGHAQYYATAENMDRFTSMSPDEKNEIIKQDSNSYNKKHA